MYLLTVRQPYHIGEFQTFVMNSTHNISPKANAFVIFYVINTKLIFVIKFGLF